MFKKENFEDELVKSMSQNLASNQVEKKYSFDKISKAADFINAAAEIFDDTGFHAEAEVLTRMLERIASLKFEKKKLNKQAQAFNDLTPEEIAFYQGLPPHVKQLLERHIKKTPEGADISELVNEIKLLYSIKSSKDPEVLEFESLTGTHPQKAPIVDFNDAASKKKV